MWKFLNCSPFFLVVFWGSQKSIDEGDRVLHCILKSRNPKPQVIFYIDKQMDENTEEALVKATSLRIKSEHNKFSDFMNNKQAQESAVSMFSQDGKYKIDEVISFIRNNAHDYPSPNFELAFAELLEFITSKEHNPHYYAELKCTIEDEFPYVYRLCRDADISESGILDMIMYYMINSSAMPPFRDTYK